MEAQARSRGELSGVARAAQAHCRAQRSAGLLATTRARDGGGLRCAGVCLRHDSGVRLRVRLCADGGTGPLGLG